MLLSIHRPDPKEPVLELRSRMEGDQGQIGDFRDYIRPGQSFLGWTYSELLALGNGLHELQPKQNLRLWKEQS